MIDYLSLAIEKEKEFESRFRRNDQDIELIKQAKRILYDTAKDKREIPNSIYVPLNDVLVFATTVESYLDDADEQIVVTSNDENLDTAKVEEFIKAIWVEVDNHWRKGIWTGGKQCTFNSFINQQATRRGRTAAPCIFRFENGALIPDIRRWDTRYVVYGYDKDGLLYASRTMTRAADLVAQDYPDVKLPVDKKSLKLRDIWTREENIFYVEGNEAFREPHRYGFCPVVIETVPIGFQTDDEDSLQYEGESIFLMIRDIFPELVRLASIIQSLNAKELDHAIQMQVDKDSMDGSSPPTHDDLTDPRNVTKVAGQFAPMPIGELRSMAESLHNILETRMQRGGINSFDMGTFNQQMSAVALIRVGQGRDKVYTPRLVTRGNTKRDLIDMAIKQTLAEAKRTGVNQVKIGRQTYDISDIKGEYDIEFKYAIRDTTMDAARQSIAATQRGTIPRKFILRDTLQLDDWEGAEREMYSEEAEYIFPNIKKKRILLALAKQAEDGDEDAQQDLEIGLAELGINLDQLYAGQIPQSTPPEPPKPAQPLNIFDTAGGGAAANV
jgi:hypothetical protein